MSENSQNNSYLPFSQRNGFEDIPPQLQIGEVSAELRRLLHYAVYTDLIGNVRTGLRDIALFGPWVSIIQDIFVRFLQQPIDECPTSIEVWQELLKSLISDADLPELFNFIEFLLRHRNCSASLKHNLQTAFSDSRAAYRVFDNDLICAVGTGVQAEAFTSAIDAAGSKGANGAKQHLLKAGTALKLGDWPGSVRESIHAVESAAVLIAPQEGTLGAALKSIEKSGQIHGALKSTFAQLYGYASDEKGVRHALVFEEKSKVDEVDALFMLGACASFVSYLLARIPYAEGEDS